MEAPHLTAIEQKYAKRGLVVLGVNAWNEPREHVARYVRDNRLTHRILLNGERVAKELYGARSLPATFLIGKDGTIVRRLIGFHESDLRRLDEWIQELL
ncbi:MAG: TlpA family protein disulfide reductase [bacterium]|nr:TlpA family protein disulfide reductase [bacterium]